MPNKFFRTVSKNSENKKNPVYKSFCKQPLNISIKPFTNKCNHLKLNGTKANRKRKWKENKKLIKRRGDTHAGSRGTDKPGLGGSRYNK